MRNLLAAAAIVAAVASAACGGDSTTRSAPTAKPATPVASTTTATPRAASTPVAAATSQPQGSVVEVTGIVGGVSLSGRVIEIRRLQGAAVTQIAVDPTTVIRKAAGGTLQLKDVRTSDRIIAKGTLNDRRDQLVATEITVQDAVPGAQPGG